MELAGYQLLERVGEDGDRLLYRMRRMSDQHIVMCVTTRDTYAGDVTKAGFKREYDLLLLAEGGGAVQPIALHYDQGRPLLLVEDFGGAPLQQLTVRGLVHSLTVAVEAAKCLAQIHYRGIVHQSVRSSHFLVHPDTLEMKLIGLHRGFLLEERKKEWAAPSSLAAFDVGSQLSYMAPEQTGRLAAQPDFRSDVYSLGVTLYEWLGGRKPFDRENATELVYSHIADRAKPLASLNAAIPQRVSNIISTCIEKEAELRYPNAYAVYEELSGCLEQLLRTGKISDTESVAQHWSVTQGIYGREQECLELQQALEQRNGIVLVEGQAGIGKTAFVREVLRQRKNMGVLISGKFELAAADIPYSAWIQAIDELVSWLLMLPDDDLEIWKLAIAQAIGGYEQLLINWAPKLAILLDESHPLQSLPLIEEKQRFQQVMRAFIRLFAGTHAPLTIFFDDLQWADEASLQLIEHLFHDSSSSLQLVGTCRNSEEAGGAWQSWKLKNKQPLINVIVLSPLTLAAVSELLPHKLGGKIKQLDKLASLVFDKTGGNPLRILSFVQYGINQGLFHYRPEDQAWDWSIKKLAQLDDQLLPFANYFATGRLAVINEQVLDVLSWAALIGRRFELALLIRATGISREGLLLFLQEAVRFSILQRTEDVDQFIFLHDQLRQDCLARIPESSLLSYHYKLGNIWKYTEASESALFEAVVHLNRARMLIHHREEELELAQLNYQAGLRAMQSAAWTAALRYFREAAALVQEKGWQDSLELTFNIVQQRAMCEFLCGEYKLSNGLFAQLLERVANDIERSKIYITMIQLESISGNNRRALELADTALKMLGVKSTRNDSSMAYFSFRWYKLSWKLRGGAKHTEQIPQLKDERIKAIMEVYMHSNTARFEVSIAEWMNSILDSLELTLRYGHCPEAVNAYVGMAMIHTALREYDKAYQWGAYAKRIATDHPAFKTYVLNMILQCTDTWTQHEPGLLDEVIHNIDQAGRQSVSLWQVEKSVLITVSLMLHLSRPLNEVYSLLLAHADVVQSSQDQEHIKCAAILATVIRRLIGKEDAEDPFAHIDIHDPEFILTREGSTNIFIGSIFYLCNFITSYIYGQYEETYHYAMRIKELQQEDHEKRALIYAGHNMYLHLAMAELYPVITATERKAFLATMRSEMRMMKRSATHCPSNYMHKYLLMKAEYARITDKPQTADQLYEKACQHARDRGLVHDLAIISENAGRHNIDQGRMHLARGYMAQAYQSYKQWGAEKKAALLAKQYRHLLFINSNTTLGDIDYQAVMSSVQTISEEMHMDRLLVRLMRILIHNAGAEKGALVRQDKDKLCVEAHAVSGEEVKLTSIPLEQSELPHAIISYVARTKEIVVLDHASREGIFTNIPYIRDHGVKSVLCIPMLKNDRLISLIYLENSLSAGVFTAERLDVLKLLCAQCAISIENAHLYTNAERFKQTLEEQVKERTHSLEESIRESAVAQAEASIQQDRNRIAADVHDIVGHTITSTLLQIEAAKRQMNRQPEEAKARLQGAQNMLREGLNEIRGSIHMLKGTIGDNLVQSLQQLIATTEQHAGVVVQTEIDPLSKLDQSCHHVIYHALKEGLTNGIRHGQATSFYFTLRMVDDQLKFCLKDNGSGMEPIQYGFGLNAMNERVIGFGGEMKIQAIAEGGCQLSIVIPYMNVKEKMSHVIG